MVIGSARLFSDFWAVMLKFHRILVIGLLTIPANAGNGAAKWAQAGLMLLFVLVFDLGIGPLAYAVVGEA